MVSSFEVASSNTVSSFVITPTLFFALKFIIVVGFGYFGSPYLGAFRRGSLAVTHSWFHSLFSPVAPTAVPHSPHPHPQGILGVWLTLDFPPTTVPNWPNPTSEWP